MYAMFAVKGENLFWLCSTRVCVGGLLPFAASEYDTENEVLRILRVRNLTFLLDLLVFGASQYDTENQVYEIYCL